EVDGETLNRETVQMGSSNEKIDFNLTALRTQARSQSLASSRSESSQARPQTISLASESVPASPPQVETTPANEPVRITSTSTSRPEVAPTPVRTSTTGKDQASTSSVQVLRSRESQRDDSKEKQETQML